MQVRLVLFCSLLMKVEKTVLNLRLGTSEPLEEHKEKHSFNFLSIGSIPNTNPKAQVGFALSRTTLKAKGAVDMFTLV